MVQTPETLETMLSWSGGANETRFAVAASEQRRRREQTPREGICAIIHPSWKRLGIRPYSV